MKNYAEPAVTDENRRANIIPAIAASTAKLMALSAKERSDRAKYASSALSPQERSQITSAQRMRQSPKERQRIATIAKAAHLQSSNPKTLSDAAYKAADTRAARSNIQYIGKCVQCNKNQAAHNRQRCKSCCLKNATKEADRRKRIKESKTI
jgi:hypothetical protein